MSTTSWLKANANLTWAAYYLDAPNHPAHGATVIDGGR